MSHLTESTFSKYSHNEQEYYTSRVLTSLQKEFIKNELAVVAERRLALEPDPLNYSVFIQTEAHFKGQMDAYRFILESSDLAEQEALELAQISAASQNQY